MDLKRGAPSRHSWAIFNFLKIPQSYGQLQINGAFTTMFIQSPHHPRRLFFIQYFLTLKIRMCYLDNQSPLSLTTPTFSNHAGDVLHIIFSRCSYIAILAPMAYDTSFITTQGAAETDYSYTGCTDTGVLFC